jgi:repressor LexA
MARPNNDLQHLDAMRDYFAQHRVLPSYDGLCSVLGFKSKAGAVKLAQRLIEGRYIERAPGGKLAPMDRFFERARLDDKIPAGTGDSGALSGGMEPHGLDRMLVRRPSKTRLVPIRGDSMVAAGVLDGDTAVIECDCQAQQGDFVAAMADGALTIKELRFERSRPVLVPHNPQYEVIRPQHGLEILGVVTGIVRSYARPGRAPAAGRKKP